jgi:hypothetical protein
MLFKNLVEKSLLPKREIPTVSQLQLEIPTVSQLIATHCKRAARPDLGKIIGRAERGQDQRIHGPTKPNAQNRQTLRSSLYMQLPDFTEIPVNDLSQEHQSNLHQSITTNQLST